MEIELEIFHGLSLNINLEGKRVGFIDAWKDNDVDGGVWVEYLYILENYRNKGIGTIAMKKAISLWREMGYDVISLNDIHWDKSKNFWDELGFKGVSKKKSLKIQEDT